MTVASVATNQCKKVIKMGISLFRRGFNSSKCKTMAKMAVARMKLLRNKREVVVRQMRRDIALLLESRQDATARIRVEHVIREQNIMAANEFLELFCELIVARLPIIAKQRECPADLKEGIASLIFAGPRCSDIPELLGLRDVFEKKYGKDFVSTATDLRPNAAVNRVLIEKLSVRTPSGEVKLKILKEIAKEYQVEWDTTESEIELLKPPEQLIDGPSTFVSASTLPVNSNTKQSVEPDNRTTSFVKRCSYNDPASAAEAAAESAKRAIAAAEVAAYLAKKETESGTHSDPTTRRINRRHSYNNPPARTDIINFDESDCDEEIEMEEPPQPLQPPSGPHVSDYVETKRVVNRRHSSANQNVKFDESDYEEEEEERDIIRRERRMTYQPPNRSAPQIPPRVHPKLPDYDILAARFEALKSHKSQT